MRSSKRSRLGGVIALIPTSAQRQSEERPERSVPSERGAGLVLIVDDNSDTRDLLALLPEQGLHREDGARWAARHRSGAETAARSRGDGPVHAGSRRDQCDEGNSGATPGHGPCRS